MELYNSFFIKLLIVYTITVVAHSKKTKPASEYFKLCRRDDVKVLNECVQQNLIELRPQLKKGIQGLGLVPLEPLVIPRMELSQGAGTFALNTTLTNLTIHGLGEYDVKSADMKVGKDTFLMDIAMTVPELIMTADYAMAGQILVIPIQGKGTCEMNFTDVSTICHTIGRVVQRDGVDYVDITRVTWELFIGGHSRSWFYNLFNGNKRLGDATNKFLNDNAQEAFEATKHLPQEAFGVVFKDLMARVFKLYPVDELFLD